MAVCLFGATIAHKYRSVGTRRHMRVYRPHTHAHAGLHHLLEIEQAQPSDHQQLTHLAFENVFDGKVQERKWQCEAAMIS